MAGKTYLYVTPFFPSPECWRGGYCLDAAKALAADGRYDVKVMVPGDGVDYDIDGLHVFRFRRSVLPCGVFPFALESRNNRFFAAKLRDMGLSPQDVAVVHVSSLPCAHYAAWLKRTNPATAAFVQLHLSYAFSLRSGMSEFYRSLDCLSCLRGSKASVAYARKAWHAELCHVLREYRFARTRPERRKARLAFPADECARPCREDFRIPRKKPGLGFYRRSRNPFALDSGLPRRSRLYALQWRVLRGEGVKQ